MFATIQEVRDTSKYKADNSFKELKDTEIQGYIERADIQITARVHCDYSKTGDDMIQKKLKIATIKMVDYLFFMDSNRKSVERKMSGLQSESMDDYSYSMSSQSLDKLDTNTGDTELDLILESLLVPISSHAFFGVSGPTRAKRRKLSYGIR
ncbi:DUF3199 family protein [Vagococcus fluvialis]|uniref:DUF3199 family protein n=1 Tax=Vagococcus fluvialis TaxID=2738 RepID=UPI003D0D5B25